MTTATNNRVSPIPAGTLCTLTIGDRQQVRVYPMIWPGEHWCQQYECFLPGDRKPFTIALHEQLEVRRG